MNLLILFASFFKIGIFGYGGGTGMLPLIFQTVQSLGLVTEKQFANLVAVSQVTPGPIAVNAATFVGFSSQGLAGALIATLGVVIPSFVPILIVMRLMDRYKETTVLTGIMKGVRPATPALIAAAVIFIAQTCIVNCDIFSAEMITGWKDMINWIPLAMCAVTVVMTGKFRLNPMIAYGIMALIGAFVCR